MPKCGSKKHETSACQTDVSKLTCFRCSEKGHISANCPKKNSGKGGKPSGSKGFKGKPSKGVKGKFEKGKGKGKKGKSFGKKGKLSELGADGWGPEDYWWWSDDDSWWWSETHDVNQVGDWNEQSWYGYDWHGDGWQEDSSKSATGHSEPAAEPQSDQPIGSLVISALVVEDLSDECCFDLQVSDESHDVVCMSEICLNRSVLSLEDARISRDVSVVARCVDGSGTYRPGMGATCLDVTAELCFS